MWISCEHEGRRNDSTNPERPGRCDAAAHWTKAWSCSDLYSHNNLTCSLKDRSKGRIAKVSTGRRTKCFWMRWVRFSHFRKAKYIFVFCPVTVSRCVYFHIYRADEGKTFFSQCIHSREPGVLSQGNTSDWKPSLFFLKDKRNFYNIHNHLLIATVSSVSLGNLSAVGERLYICSMDSQRQRSTYI